MTFFSMPGERCARSARQHLWPPRSALILAGFLLLAAGVDAASLRYRVQGASDPVRENIRAYLGDSPDDRAGAERFLVIVEERTAQALRSLGYYDSSIEVSVDRSVTPWRAVIAVQEGEPLRYTQVHITLNGEGGQDSTLQALLDRQAPKPEDVVHHGRYEAFKRDLQVLARRRGYFDAQFTENRVTVHRGEGRAELALVYSTGARYRVGRINADAAKIDTGLLQRLLPFSEGDFYEQAQLLDLRQRLMRLGYFSSVVVLPDVDSRQASTIPLQVDVTRAPRHSYELGVGYSTDTEQRLSLSWHSPLLNRFGHSQETRVRWSPVNPQARVTYSIPLDDPANDVLQLIARVESNEFGDLESRQTAFRVQRERTEGQKVRSTHLRALREDWGVFDTDFGANFVLAGATYSRRHRRGTAIDPSSGVSQFLSLELASKDLGSDQDLIRAYGSLTGLTRLGDNWRLVARTEAGLLWSSSRRADELPPSLAFFAGGDNSIRGYAYQSVGREISPQLLSDETRRQQLVVGGSRLLTGSLELQRYFGSNWRGALFVDGGDAFVDDFDMNLGVGFGVHYLSPVGALRLELANPVTRSDGSWRIHINIGAEF